VTRLLNWEDRLSAFLAKVYDRPYAPGEHDCMIFAGRCVETVTGQDLASPHLGKYRTEARAFVYLRSIGFDSCEAWWDANLPARPTSHARRGDIVMRADGTPCVCMGDFAVMVGTDGERDGLFRVPRDEWLKAWTVGEEPNE